MSAFDDLLAQPAGTPKPAAPAAKPSAFDALLASEAPPPVAKPAAAKPARSPSRTSAVVAGAADLIDLGLVGLPAMAVGVSADIANRIKGLVDSRSRSEVVADSEYITKTIQEAAGTPIRTLLTNLGAIDSNDVTAIGQVMEKASSLIERAGEDIEKKTGGAVLKQDFISVVNTTFASLGGRAAAIGAAKYRERSDAKAFEKATREMLVKAEEQSALTRASREAAEASAASKTQAEADLAGLATERAVRRVLQRPAPRVVDQSSAETRRLQAQVDAARVQGAGAAGVPPPELMSALAQSQLRDLERSRAAATPRNLAASQGARPEVVGPPRPFNETLDSAQRKVAEGRAFDLVPEEKIALRGLRQRIDSRTMTAAAVGATGLGLAMAFGAEPEEAALAIGAGALVLGRGQGLTLEALRTMPDATPLGTILDRSAYSLSTLEALPKNRFEFGKQQIADLLKRQDVTKAERDVLQGVLDSTPGETITAKQLMQGFKERTGDFELRAKQTSEFAEYGLENIDRRLVDDWADGIEGPDGVAPVDKTPATTTIYQSPVRLGDNNHFGDPNYFAHTRSFEEGGVKHVVELQSDFAQKAGKELSQAERAGLETEQAFLGAIKEAAQKMGNTLYKYDSTVDDIILSVENYLATARKEGAELRYKLSMGQKMAESLDNYPERSFREVPLFAQMRAHAAKYDRSGDSDALVDMALKALRDGRAATPESVPDSAARRLLRDNAEAAAEMLKTASDFENTLARVRFAEVSAKLGASEQVGAVQPMLKDWHKRLVREELASAARAGQPVVRFATADTVAKVEGWPDRIADAGGEGTPEAAAIRRNFGMREGQRFSPEHQGIYDRYSRDVTKFLTRLGGREVTDSAGHTWIEVPVEGSAKVRAGSRTLQFGAADPKLMAAVAAMSVGAATAAYLSEKENKLKNAGATAAFIGLSLFAASRAPAIAEVSRQAVLGAEGFFGNVSAEMRTISQPILRRLTTHALDELSNTYKFMQKVGPFAELLQKVPAKFQPEINAAVLTGKPEAVLAAFAKVGDPELFKRWEKAQQGLKELGKGLVEAGRLKSLLPDYYPRIVTDLEGLKNFLGVEHRAGLEEALAKAEEASMVRKGQPLSTLDISVVTNKHIESLMRSGGPGKAGFLKERKISEVTADMAKFYAPAAESLPIYVASAVREIERAKFFGKNLVRTDGLVAVDQSIGNVVSEELKAGKLKPEDYSRAVELLRSRFGPGEQGTNRLMSSLRDIGYMALLGNVFSALQNLADIPGTAFMHGLIPTAKAAVAALKKPGWKITAADLGMQNYLGDEFTRGQANPLVVAGVRVSTAKAVNTVFKYSGFQYLDTVMKETKANAAMLDYQRKALTPRGQAEIQRQYGDYFTTDMPQLLADLRAREKSRLVYELVFRELSDAQPVTRIEVPKFYLDNPNARPLWMLKSFSIKQLNLLRERGYREIAKGDPASVARGTRFMFGYGLALGLGGATMAFITDAMLGRDNKLEWGDIPINALKSFGLSQYVVDKARQGKPGEAVAGALLPPVGIAGDVLLPRERTDPDTGEPVANTSAIRYIPWIGRFVESRYLGGAERFNEREAAKREAEALGEE